jgi:hypothetical protein
MHQHRISSHQTICVQQSQLHVSRFSRIHLVNAGSVSRTHGLDCLF